jgi:DNA-directed RNA polymerase specialized sigma24 family protein
MTFAELSQVANENVNTVKARVFRGLKKIRKALTTTQSRAEGRQ